LAQKSARDNDHVRAARVRALVMSHMSFEKKSTADFYKELGPQFAELGLNLKDFSAIIARMRINNQCYYEKSQNTYLHWKGSAGAKDEFPAETAVQKMNKEEINLARTKPEFTITIIRATKRVRMNVGGMIIEIGVE